MSIGSDSDVGGHEQHILVVDDSEPNLMLLRSILNLDGYRVDTVLSGPEALDLARSEPPDLVLLDVMMPEMSGYDVCRCLKADERTAHVPIIFLTALGDVPERVTGLEAGGDDYIAKPFHPDELRARIKAALRTKQVRDRLQRERQDLAAQAVTDPLTGVYNRRMLDARLQEEVIRARRYGHCLTCLMLDLDFFKAVNDDHGHPTGDAVLRRFVQATHACLRGSDVLARYGGEEFVILVTETDLAGATVTAEKVRRRIEETEFQAVNGAPLRVTASIGVAELEPDDTPESLLARADQAMYRAKHDGRNRVVSARRAEPSEPSGKRP